MQVVFIRHGEPDYTPCYERGFIGHGKDLACLTERGGQQALAVARHPSLHGIELIVSSPYTRALQTAAIISRETQKDIRVEIDLHEFMPDKTFQYKGQAESDALHADFLLCKGTYPPGERRRWETVEEIRRRVAGVMDKYLGLQKIAVVAHGGVIRRFTGRAPVDFCTPYEVEYHEGFVCYGWV